MVYLVDSQDTSIVAKAIKEHGAENVYWLISNGLWREALRMGLSESHLITYPMPTKDALSAMGEGATLYVVEQPKTPSKKSSPKKTDE
tara:strand:- start:381 stop:644 length:264 start_codon:yes stop_codon:yes gene_type:complete